MKKRKMRQIQIRNATTGFTREEAHELRKRAHSLFALGLELIAMVTTDPHEKQVTELFIKGFKRERL